MIRRKAASNFRCGCGGSFLRSGFGNRAAQLRDQSRFDDQPFGTPPIGYAARGRLDDFETARPARAEPAWPAHNPHRAIRPTLADHGRCFTIVTVARETRS